MAPLQADLTFRQVTALKYAAEAGVYGERAQDKIVDAVGLTSTRCYSAAESAEDAVFYWSTSAGRAARLAIKWLVEDSTATNMGASGPAFSGSATSIDTIRHRHYRSGALCVCGHLYAVHEPGPHCQTVDGCTSCGCQIFDPTVPMEAAL